ncbi:hypothetical protein [Arenimonas sp.]|uniref:hypothetical protein n=1 Tax=Arenimonas sp. TaxID=1872635 RepID=UPI0025BECD29|nr:hypothetical protein [Arenimonas sp.]
MSALKYTPVPGSTADKLLAILADGVERSCRELVAASGCSPGSVNSSLVGAVNRGVLVTRERADGKAWQLAEELWSPQHQTTDGPQIWNAWLYSLGSTSPTPDVSEAAAPKSAGPGFSLARDGHLTISCAAVSGELSPTETKALIEYLIAAADTVDEAFAREVAS